MTKLPAHSLLSLATIVALSACSGSDAGSPTPGSGGETGTGGAEGFGGSNSMGGSTATGGQTPNGSGATGGVVTTGGINSTGGLTAVGGNSATPTGGANATGGMATVATGGAAATGGTATTGGSNASGGLTTIGGNSATGGSKVTGGTNSTGGTATSTGGTKATGGTNSAGGTATGGIKATGGATATGGAPATGGSKASTGGSPATGGGTSTGSCVESTCGSHKWACWHMPTPASEALPNAQNYSDLGNGAVRDNVTCLVWEKANPSTTSSWQVQFDRCAALASSNYGGFNDWRLPTRVEMASITDVTRGSTGFPAIFTVTGGYYTTDSRWFVEINSTAGRVWGYGRNGFTSNNIFPTSGLVARCVRGNGTGEAVGTLAVEPPSHYTVTGTGTSATVKDNYTGLIWQQTYSTSRMAFSATAAYCASQTTGGLTSGWRVPTLTELASLVNEARVGSNATNGAVVLSAFPGTNGSCNPDGWYWASESSTSIGGQGWGISYCDGYTGWNLPNAATTVWNYFIDGWVRCVHN